jgi:hypothetical protein
LDFLCQRGEGQNKSNGFGFHIVGGTAIWDCFGGAYVIGEPLQTLMVSGQLQSRLNFWPPGKVQRRVDSKFAIGFGGFSGAA